ncbi:Sad1 and UNC84 domain containing 1 [Phyllostomus discolor]|uniref:Sad1 and UNC84 domain containing 1 n=1 Tax=Phyllostomus discolor TaxID=89673 RepID=A0A833YVW8_9CHIR|nr:Sad1 and UNC84 domain containing 1 [Phyllostomus discolor]
MDFSRLHTYTPPQCVPENTGYTYALSSSYSSDALDFETQHRLDPVFDSPTGNITSAPRDFSVYGLENEHQEEGQLLGQFVYDQDGESLQTFPVLRRPERGFQIVELRVSSNWGHPEYTCLYRFRVHGEPVQ